MKAINSDRIEGVFHVPYFRDIDQRSSFSNLFSGNTIHIDSSETEISLKEVFVSTSKQNVIRGMHIQVEPFASRKIVIPLYGRVLDVITNLLIDSRCYNKVQELKPVSLGIK
jgi:dTDP-4-dehydrorhamnose 3,5-epimerase-like enzyme